MPASAHVTVRVDLQKIHANAESIKKLTGVKLYAVVKADSYGLGACHVVQTLADVADAFCVLTLAESIAAEIWKQTGKPSIALASEGHGVADDFLLHRVRPAVWDESRASELRRADPLLSVDTGMQRFACPAERIDAVLSAGQCREAFTHATDLGRVKHLLDLVGNRGLTLHAAGSSLLHEPAARLDAVRPGLVLYDGAVRASTRLVDTRRSTGPVGYSGFSSEHHGVIRAGYSHGLKIGPCLINNRPSRVLEVGMQTAYVETASTDKTGDEVVLLGDSLAALEVARSWGTSAHEVIARIGQMGARIHAS